MSTLSSLFLLGLLTTLFPLRNLQSYLIILLLSSLPFLAFLCSYSPYSLFSFGSFINDNITILLVYVTLFLILTSLVGVDQQIYNPSPSTLFFLLLAFVLLYLSSFLVFSTSNVFFLYISYEASLIPISYIILKWGVYPDRGYSGLIILLFTSIFTFPLSIFLLSLNLYYSSFNLFVIITLPQNFSGFFCFWILLSFAVKLPMYGLHFWLPMAHVEAPTFGSIILAGLLLKIGGCGLLRLYPLLSQSVGLLSSLITSYLLFSIILSSILTSIQSDFNRLVAYSSVVHMTMLVLLIFTIHPLSLSVLLILIVFHAFSSPVLFYLVGTLYTLLNTRQLFLLRGVTFLSPFLSFMVILIFLLNIPVPPLPSFLSEVLYFISIYYYSPLFFCVPLLLILLVLIYNLTWLAGTISSPSLLSVPFIFISYRSYLILFSYILVSFLFIFVIPLF